MKEEKKGRGRPKKEQDAMAELNAKKYIRRKFDANPYFWPCEDNQMQNEAKESFESMKDMQCIWSWIEKHLDDDQKKRIYSALRAKSSRKNNVNKTRVVSLTLTSEEYMRLLALTNDDLKTVGDVIKMKLFKSF